ncbi:MAG: hypothetical protein PWQ17_2685, partial [Anaerophaga sp.]|nr:hypothetical protein [Anaerophaga sp.]
KGDFFKLLIFSSSPLGVRGKNGKNQQFEGFLYCTHYYFEILVKYFHAKTATPYHAKATKDYIFFAILALL